MEHEVHISSIVIQTLPAAVKGVVQVIEGIEGAEIPLSDPSGKIVVVLTCHQMNEITAFIGTLRDVDGVITVTMVFHQIETQTGLDEEVA